MMVPYAPCEKGELNDDERNKGMQDGLRYVHAGIRRENSYDHGLVRLDSVNWSLGIR